MRGSIIWTCSSCLKAERSEASRLRNRVAAFRAFRSAPPLASAQVAATKAERDDGREADKERGAMSRRLAEMTEEAVDIGGSSTAKNVEAAGFSEELKKKLEARIVEGAFRSQNQRSFAEAELPTSAGKGTREQASAQPWTGSESLHDSTLRMLDDSHKRLRGIRAPRIPQPSNLRPAPKKSDSTGQRLANARDRTSIYAAALSNEMSEEERNKMRKELKERFSPGARPMPTTLQGLTSLANERIEDAIARGKFKNIPRGKGKNIERDYNASSPFLDTTEYFMNKIIQKQEIVPPWIEKQQELVKGVASFRGRLRNDWKRHAARTIASKGGSLESQIRRAKAYALAEEKVNPAQTRVENLSKIDSQGNLSTVSVQETAPKPLTAQLAQDEQARSEPPTITVTEQPLKPTTADTSSAPSSPSPSPSSHPLSPSEPSPNTPQPAPILPMSDPFRDPSWEATEKSYHTLAINTLNSLTRSYNLMAPKLAQKPYLSLARELNRCYAEVAPLLPEEIRQRARTPVSVMAESGGGVGKEAKGGVLDRWGGHETRAIRDEDLSRKGYGFKEFWRDIFAKKS